MNLASLSPEQQTKLLSFLGFGNSIAPAVFIGMEEGLTMPPSLMEQLLVRTRFETMMDLAESAKAHPEKYLSGPRPPIQPTWNLIIRVLLALEGNLTPTNDEIRYYQRDRLGRRTEAGALLELMPLPCSKIGDWPYREIFAQYPNRESYLDHLLHLRIDALKQHLSYGPALVVAYGSGYWQHYRRVFPNATKWNLSGPFELADVASTRVVLTPHFTARTMNGRREKLIALCTQRVA